MSVIEPRAPVTDIQELRALDPAEVVEGYHDGLAGDEEPGGNRSKSYWHGWRNGRSDRSGQPDAAQRALARAFLEAGGRNPNASDPTPTITSTRSPA